MDVSELVMDFAPLAGSLRLIAAGSGASLHSRLRPLVFVELCEALLERLVSVVELP